MAKKTKKKEEELKAGWMTSYADLVTVLFALFVMLYALSEVDEELWAQFAIAAARNPTVSPFDFGAQGVNELTGNGISLLPHFELQDFNRPQNIGGITADGTDMSYAAADMLTYFADQQAGPDGQGDGLDLQDAIEVFYHAGVIHIMFIGDMYFDSGRATLRPEILPIIDHVGNSIAYLLSLGHDIVVEVVGHTDNQPIATAQFPSNWWLSVGRATTVVERLISIGAIDARNITPSGRGEFEPIDDNTTIEGRQRNRRVEIFIRQVEPVQVLPIIEE